MVLHFARLLSGQNCNHHLSGLLWRHGQPFAARKHPTEGAAQGQGMETRMPARPRSPAHTEPCSLPSCTQ